MKQLSAVLCGLALIVTVMPPALAQQPAPQPAPGGPGQHGQMPMGGPGGSPTNPMMPGMMSGAMCPMMGGMMGGGMGMMQGMAGGPMMGMMGGSQDPKMLGRMLQMRADMMRAMADVLARHGKAMEEGK